MNLNKESTPNTRLREVRRQLKLTQEEMSKKLVMTQAGYSDVERGKVGVSKRIIYLLGEMGVNTDYIVTGEGQPFNSEPPARDRIEVARNTLGMTQEQMARKLGVSEEEYKKIEKGPATEEVLEKIGDLGVNINWLRTGEGEPLTGYIPHSADRVIEVIRYLGIDILDFIEKLKISDTEKYKFIKEVQEGKELDKEILIKITEEYPQISKNFLLKGEGSLGNGNDLLRQHLKLTRKYIALLEQRIKELEAENMALKNPHEGG